MDAEYSDGIRVLRDNLGLYEVDSYLMLKKLIKRTKDDKDFLFDCSHNLCLFISLIEIICCLPFLEGTDEKIIKRLSELSLLIGIVRNISSLSKELRSNICESCIFFNLKKLVYDKKNDETIGILNIIGFEIVMIKPESHLTLSSCFCDFNCELFLLPCRILQLLANLAVDSCVEYQNSIFEKFYPFGSLSYCLFELIMLNKLESTNINININTTAVESVYHLLFILFKNRPDLLDYALEKKDFLNSFIYISLSMHTYSLRFICERESKHSEWIFFLFKYIITKDPSYFCDLYSFECSEDTTMECDSSLMYLTILEPFVRISMIKNNLKNISDLMMPQAIREIQNFISKTIISSLEYKDILLNIIFELDTNVNLKDANNKSILFSILQEKINKEIAICEMNKYYSHLSKYLTEKLEFVKVNNTLLINNHSNTDVGISNIVNIKTWISLFQIELDNYEFDNSFFEEIFRILSSILKCMLDFRREFIKFEEIKIKVEGSIWTNTSQVVSISSLLQAILTISLKNKYLLSKIKELDEVIETIVECTKITDENHPLIKESSMLLLRALSESSYELANKIFKYSKN